MPLSRAVEVPPPRAVSAGTRVSILALLVAAAWADVLARAARADRGGALPVWLAAAAGLATQLVFTAGEAAAAVQAWRALGAEVRWRSLAPQLLVVSSVEAFAVAIAAGGTTLPRGVAVWLAGARAAGGTPPVTGLAFAFAAFGVLTVTRLLLSAHAQSRLARASFGRGLAVVLALYLATRAVMCWGFDLMQGRSFQSWGTCTCPGRASSA